MWRDFVDLLKHTTVYGAGRIASKITGLLLLPLYTRLLTPGEYGILEILAIVGLFCQILFQFGLESAVFVGILQEKVDDLRETLTTAFCFLLASAAVAIGLGWLLAPDIAYILVGSTSYGHLVFMTVVAAAVQNIIVVPRADLRIEEKSALYSTLSWAGFAASLVLRVVAVAVLKAGVDGLVWADVISAVVNVALFFPVLRNSVGHRISGTRLLRLLSFGVPLIPMQISVTVLNSVDRYFLRYYGSLDEVGIYGLGYRFGMTLMLIVNSFQLIWPAKAFQMAKLDRASLFFGTVGTYYVLGMSFAGLALSLLAKDVIRIMADPSFLPAHLVVAWICLAYALYGIFYVTSIGIHIRQQTWYLTATALISAVMHVIFNFLLIPSLGAMGAAISTALGFSILAVSSWVVSMKVYPIRYEWGRLAKIVILVCFFYGLGSLVTIDNVWYSLVVRSLVLALYAASFLVVGFLREDEKCAVSRFLKLVAGRFALAERLRR